MIRLEIPGHCFSLKTHREAYRLGKKCPCCGKRNGRISIGKSKALRKYEKWGTLCLQNAWGGQAPLEGDVRITITYHYAGVKPDSHGPSETIHDLLQAAGVIADDVQLIPWGTPAVARIHVNKADEKLEIILEPMSDSVRKNL